MKIFKLLHNSHLVDLTTEQALYKYKPYLTRLCKAYPTTYFDDYYQASTIGLLNALDTYDHTKGVQFQNYLHWYVGREFSTLSHQLLPASISYQKFAWASKFERARAKNPSLTFDQFVADTKLATMKDSTVDDIRTFMGQDLTVEELDTIPEPAQEPTTNFWGELNKLLGEKYTNILRLKFSGHTFESIGASLGCTRQNVKLSYDKAMDKLSKNKKLLLTFAEI